MKEKRPRRKTRSIPVGFSIDGLIQMLKENPDFKLFHSGNDTKPSIGGEVAIAILEHARRRGHTSTRTVRSWSLPR